MTTENNIMIIVVPGMIALLLLGVFSFLYKQTRREYFRAWQIGWAAYSLSYLFLSLYFLVLQNRALLLTARYFFGATILSVFISTFLIEDTFRWRKQYFVIAAILVAWST